jgi:hypothetical protein
MSVGSAQRLVDHAVQLYEAAGRPLPRSLETLAQDVHSLDVRLSYDLSKALSGLDEVGARAHYQRTLGERSQGAASEQKRHQGAGRGAQHRRALLPQRSRRQARAAPGGVRALGLHVGARRAAARAQEGALRPGLHAL